MRNEPLTGYLLHHKPYQESRALYYFFTPTHGVVHGVGKKGMPLFAPIKLFATGKRSLKSFSQIQPISAYRQPTGQTLYAGFYLNEVLWKLLKNEDEMSKLWHAYQLCLNHLANRLDKPVLTLLLRQFERVLFDELGYSIDYHSDSQNQPIDVSLVYRFVPDEGFIIAKHTSDFHNANFSHTHSHNANSNKQPSQPVNTLTTVSLFSGQILSDIGNYLQQYPQQPQSQPLAPLTLNQGLLREWSRLHKQMIDHLLDYQPLKSRELWRQFARY